MNIYEMYHLNGDSVGFWVRRNSWSNHYLAKIKRIGNLKRGPLLGSPPYYRSQIVYADIYRDGKCVRENQIITCPGTHGYELVDTEETRAASAAPAAFDALATSNRQAQRSRARRLV